MNRLATTIVIDTRESFFLPLLKSGELARRFPEITFLGQCLETGDFLVNDQYIIERKTHNDLYSSIIDGRFRTQRERMKSFLLSQNQNDKDVASAMMPIYIIEGSKLYDPRKRGVNAGALRNLVCHHRIPFLCTENQDDTLECLVKMASTVEKPATSCLVKKPQMPAKNVVSVETMMISCIPGISPNTANDLTSKYPTLTSLMELTLSDLCDTQLSNGKRLGKSRGGKIYAILHKTSHVMAQPTPVD